MKRLFLTLICFLTFCGIADARMLQGVAGAIPATTSCSPTYLLEENFDCSSGCSANCSGTDGLTNCTYLWTKSGTVNFQATGLIGTYSMEIDETGGVGYAYKDFTESTEAYVYFVFSIDTLPSPSSTKMIASLTNVATKRISLYLTSAGKLNISSSGADSTTVDGISAGTKYAIWWGGNKGTGANATAYVGFAPYSDGTETKPTSGDKYASVPNGANQSNLVRLYLGYGTTTHKLTYDKIRVTGSDICSPTP